MPISRLAARFGAVALTTAALLGSVAVAAGAGVAVPDKGVLPPKNPAHNVAPSPNFLYAASCGRGGDSAACNTIVLHAVAHARKVLEKLGGMSFSLAAYEKLTPDEQLFASANLERIERGLPAIAVLTRSLDKVAQVGAADDTIRRWARCPAHCQGAATGSASAATGPVALTTRSAPITAGCTTTQDRPGATVTTSSAGTSARRPAAGNATRSRWARVT